MSLTIFKKKFILIKAAAKDLIQELIQNIFKLFNIKQGSKLEAAG